MGRGTRPAIAVSCPCAGRRPVAMPAPSAGRRRRVSPGASPLQRRKPRFLLLPISWPILRHRQSPLPLRPMQPHPRLVRVLRRRRFARRCPSPMCTCMLGRTTRSSPLRTRKAPPSVGPAAVPRVSTAHASPLRTLPRWLRKRQRASPVLEKARLLQSKGQEQQFQPAEVARLELASDDELFSVLPKVPPLFQENWRADCHRSR